MGVAEPREYSRDLVAKSHSMQNSPYAKLKMRRAASRRCLPLLGGNGPETQDGGRGSYLHTGMLQRSPTSLTFLEGPATRGTCCCLRETVCLLLENLSSDLVPRGYHILLEKPLSRALSYVELANLNVSHC